MFLDYILVGCSRLAKLSNCTTPIGLYYYCGPKGNWRQCLCTFFLGGGGDGLGITRQWWRSLKNLPLMSRHIHLNGSRFEDRNNYQGYHHINSEAYNPDRGYMLLINFIGRTKNTVNSLLPDTSYKTDISLRRTPGVCPYCFSVILL